MSENLRERTSNIQDFNDFMDVYTQVKELVANADALVEMVNNVNDYIDQKEFPFEVKKLQIGSLSTRKRSKVTTAKEKMTAVLRAISDNDNLKEFSTSDIKAGIEKHLGCELNSGVRADIYKYLIDKKWLKVNNPSEAARNRTYSIIGGKKGLSKAFEANEIDEIENDNSNEEE